VGLRWRQRLECLMKALPRPETGSQAHQQDVKCRQPGPTARRPGWGRLSTGRGSPPWHLGPDPIGCLSFTHRLSGAWQVREEDHVWEKRCSELDLLSCDQRSGYAARDFKTRETGVAYDSLRLRDGVRATPSSSPLVCRIVGAPPLGAPARVFPGRTLWEGEGRVGSRTSPQLQITPFVPGLEPAWVPVPVPAESQ